MLFSICVCVVKLSARDGCTLSCGRKLNPSYACVVKPHSTLKLKNASKFSPLRPLRAALSVLFIPSSVSFPQVIYSLTAEGLLRDVTQAELFPTNTSPSFSFTQNTTTARHAL